MRVGRETAVAVTLCAMLLTATGEAAAQAPPVVLDELRATFRTAVREVGIVGAGLQVVAGDRVVFADATGLADVEANRPVDASTIFHWASITKTLTAVAVMQLRDAGRLSLDDPAVKHLPELRAVHSAFGPVEAVTIRHLLSHSAGLRSPTWPWGGDKPWHPFEPPGWAQVTAMLPYTEVEFAPGSKFQYSNPGIVFLGRIIETISGEDYEVYVDKHILRPLEMRDSYFDATPPFLIGRKSHSYTVRDGERRARPFDPSTGVTVSNGGLNGPVGDLARWVRFLIGRPADEATRARYDAVLARASLEEMWRPQVDAPGESEAPDRPVRVGLGWFLETHGGRTYVAHSGNQNGFIAHLYVDPPRGLGYVVVFNTLVQRTEKTPRGTGAVDRELRELIFAKVFPALEAR
ncbi:MAG: beta-lactamase family protein [Chloroflexi bacterium]|nr:beta-lactamase family protein [Chloroflexota bacterium]